MPVKPKTCVEPDHWIIEGTNGGQAIVSECDWLFLVGYSWSLCPRDGYFRCNNRDTFNGYKVHGRAMHWFVAQLMRLEIPEGFEIDHIDRNKFDNRRLNLRAASREIQKFNRNKLSSNTSGYIGVHFDNNKWIASIRINGKINYLGYFDDPEEASEVYQAAKKERDEKEIAKCLNKSPQ